MKNKKTLLLILALVVIAAIVLLFKMGFNKGLSDEDIVRNFVKEFYKNIEITHDLNYDAEKISDAYIKIVQNEEEPDNELEENMKELMKYITKQQFRNLLRDTTIYDLNFGRTGITKAEVINDIDVSTVKNNKSTYQATYTVKYTGENEGKEIDTNIDYDLKFVVIDGKLQVIEPLVYNNEMQSIFTRSMKK